ncbi:uncharacterized protein LOC142625225 [Castanea sativa]|uniref:uncharacterized protein LOC142625225 n=1 Tax=Castanea sativa TaxID=21020 RepID=UPI003F64D0CB
MDAMSRALRQAARSPFSRDIEGVPMPSKFTRPPFNSYTGKTDSVEHLGPAACGRVTINENRGWRNPSQLRQSILGVVQRDRRGNEKIAISTFRMGLPEESGLRESLTLRPPEDMRQLMKRIEEYKRLEDDWLQTRGKAPIIIHPQNTGFNPKLRKDLRIQEPSPPIGGVNAAFKEPVHKIIDRIKNEPYFKRPNKMVGDSSRRNQNLYCTYYKDKGHTTEQCRVLKDHLEQLVKAGHLKEFLVEMGNQETGQEGQPRRNPLPPPLGVIKVIRAVPRGIRALATRGVQAVISTEDNISEQSSGKRPRYTRQPIAFDDDDLEGTTQPHHDALIVTARIRGFIVKRIMVDQGSGADVMYPDLYKGLGLKKRICPGMTHH